MRSLCSFASQVQSSIYLPLPDLLRRPSPFFTDLTIVPPAEQKKISPFVLFHLTFFCKLSDSIVSSLPLHLDSLRVLYSYC